VIDLPVLGVAAVGAAAGLGRSAWEVLRVAVDVTPVFKDYFARNRGPVPADSGKRQPPNYGVLASLDGAMMNLTLTFRTGSA
jgi:hypothetical protein